MKRLGALISGLVLAAAPVAASAQDRRPPAQSPEAPSQSGDEAAVRGVVEAFAAAFNKGDTAALAALFTPDAQIETEDGTIIAGREAVIDRYAQALAAEPRPTVALKPRSITFLAHDVALEEGESTLTRGEGDTSPEVGRYSVLYVRRDGKWLHARVREMPPAVAEPSPHDRLQELEWMIGQWVNESGDGVIETSCDWADGGAFLLRTFTIRIHGRPAMTGTQRIGWDPLRRQFRSWMFDSDGGFAEGSWSGEGDRWVVKSIGVTSGGLAASGTQIVTRLNKDTSTWTSTHRALDGQTIEDIDEFRLVRQPPRPGSGKTTRDGQGTPR